MQSGHYHNASEVLGEGLRLTEQRGRLEAAKLKLMKEAADKGWADIAGGDDQLEDFIRQMEQ
jgi:antitoxin ParD1/3/4